jgi:signal transduction histidine kinase
VIFACCFVFSLLYISDSIKIVSRTLFVFEYPIGFAGRHISPLLLLVSFLFLICEIARENRTLVQKKALEDVAQQVVHDLRSPLAALAAAEPELLQLPEEARLLLRSAISRIRDISYHLIRTYQNPDLLVREATHPRTSHSASVELLSTLLDGLVSEKRIQYRSKIGVSIDWRMTNEAYGLFAQVQTGAFKRILSNLIDNSVEALSDSGKVILDLKSNGNTIEITCQDNGKGIPREVISQLGKKGLSYEKKGGSGLGLYNAKSILQNWGGRLQIESELNVGTQVTLFLPRSPCPEWFVPEVNLFSYSTILVLDDDESIHHIWDGIFDKNRYLNPSAEIFHFCHGQHLRDWVAVDPERASRALFLVDYELIHSQETGLDMIVELNAHSRSILVTSKYENKDVRNGCQDLGVKIIPKCVAPFVPVC